MDKKMMDPSSLWQWRIRHVKKHSKCSDPFKHSHVIGVDFDVGSIKDRKVDLKLVTNGVIIEICDFATTVTRGEKHFIANILENNFDLGLENEQQRVDFTNELAYRVEDLLRKPSTDKHEVFPLFDTPDCDGNNKNRLNMECLSEEMDEAHVEDIKHQNRVHSSEEHSDDLQEDVLVSTFPYCDKIGLNFGVQAKQNLDQHLLTKGVLLEVAHSAKVLCGSYDAIILKVLEHNFELDLKGQEEKKQVLFSITTLMKRTKRLMVNINQVISTFRKEQFPFHTMVEECDLFNKDAQQSRLDEVTKKTSVLKGKKHKRTLVDKDESASKRCRREQSEHLVPHHTDLYTFPVTDGDSLTWLLEEYNRDLKREMDSNNAEDWDVCKEVFRKSESTCDSIQNPFLTTGNSSSSLPSGSPPLPSNLNEMKRCVFQELTHTSTSAHNVCDMEKKNIETTVSTKHEEKALLVTDEPVSEREQSGHRDHHGTDLDSYQITSADDSYMCPLSETELDSDGETDSRNDDSRDEKDLQSSLSSEVQKESESNCADFHRSFLSATDSSSSLPSVNAPPGGSTDDKKSSEGCEQTHRLRNSYNGCDIDQEETNIDYNLWKMRANRVKRILFTCNEEYYIFGFSKKAGIDYNFGFGPKQKRSVDSLAISLVVEIVKFATAMSSSQQDFIMEILEHNFDLHLENDSDRSAFAYETMNRVRQLRNSDMSKFSKETFELPLPSASVKQENENKSSVSVVFSSASIEGECSSQECSQNSHPEAEVIVSEENMDPYPYCKEIGLKLFVNNSQSVKLDVNTLTKGAISEVANFADKLSGTFEQIFLDVLKHNFDFDNPSYHSDLAKIIFMHIPFIVEQKGIPLSRLKNNNMLSLVNRLLDPRFQHQNNTNVDVCTSGSSQAPVMNQNVGSSAETELQNKPSEAKELWKLRAHKINQILSDPHMEHCPLYSYSRCKKIGMDFNFGSEVKPNLDAKLLTNGIMLALNTFAEALHKTTDYFITEILEYNFHLDLKGEQHRKAFEFATMNSIRSMRNQKKNLIGKRGKMLFELPDPRHVKIYYTKMFCPACYQNRNQQPGEHASVSGSMHPQPYAMTETPSADCSSQKLVVCPAVEEAIMDYYPYCKEIGLSLCVNRNKPREKLSEYVLTHRVVDEVYNFATKLGGVAKNKIIDDIIEHNFNISAKLRPAVRFSTKLLQHDAQMAWLNEVFIVEPVCKREDKTLKRERQERKKREERLRAVQNQLESDTTNICNEWDVELEEIETEDNMWKMRAKRVKNILSEMSRDFWDFFMSRITSLELNIGFGAKKNLSFDYLSNKLVVEVAKFVIAMNSSQQDFVIEILENNFELKLENDLDRCAFAYETMTRVRQLLKSEDIIKVSKELFELPVPMISNHITKESRGSVSTEPASASGETECNSKDCSQDSLPKAKENVSETSDDPYPFCKEIGLKLFANKSQPVKLDVNSLTNGAMVEVANFAEKLCGTFEQIFLDVLRHNFDLENQNDYSDLLKNILLHFPLIVEQNSFSLFAKTFKSKLTHSRKPLMKQLFSPSIDVDIFSSGYSQTPAMNHNVGTSIENEQQNEPSEHEELWKLRADHVKQILSTPHEHHCLLYPYSRCKKLGMDFSLASVVKPNLDPKLLTNGLMVEIHTFARALQSAKEHFVTEILEYNFDLDLKNEEYRKHFGQQTLLKMKALIPKKLSSKKSVSFEFPDSKEVEEACYSNATYCPKCNQTTSQKPGQDEHLSGYMHHQQPHVKSETTSAGANCSPQNPFIFPAVEKKIQKCYPLCSKIGLKLCVNKAQPKEKLPKHLLTFGAMVEVINFAKRLCGHSRSDVINDVVRHYFKIRKDVNLAVIFNRVMEKSDGHLAWLNEVFFPQPVPPRRLPKTEKQNLEMKFRVMQRQLALQTMKGSSFKSSEKLCDKKKKNQNVSVELPAKEKGQKHKQNEGNPVSSLDNNDNSVSSTDHSRTQGHAQIKEETYEPHYGDVGPDTPQIYPPHYENVKREMNPQIVQSSVKRKPPASSPHTWVTMCPNPESGVKTEPTPQGLNYYSLAQPLGLKGNTMVTVCPDTVNSRYLVPVVAIESKECSMMTVRQNYQINTEQQSVSAGSHVTVPVSVLHHDISTQTNTQMTIKEEEDL